MLFNLRKCARELRPLADRHTMHFDFPAIRKSRDLIDRSSGAPVVKKQAGPHTIDVWKRGQVQQRNIHEYDIVLRESRELESLEEIAEGQLGLLNNRSTLEATVYIDCELAADVAVIVGNQSLANWRWCGRKIRPGCDVSMWHDAFPSFGLGLAILRTSRR
jgi:hypothetical protein